jgi:uncharacterized protein
MRIAQQNTEAELDAFEAVCQRLAGFDASLDAEWVDGYLTALAAGPLVTAPEVWLPRLCGDAFERAFADPDDVVQALSALAGRTRVLADQLDPESLLDQPDTLRLQPLVAMWDEATRAQAVAEAWVTAEEASLLVSGEIWASGFLTALEDFAADWPDPGDADEREIKDDLLQQVQALTLPDGEALQAHLAKWQPGRTLSRDELIDEACFAVQDLRVWWLDHAPKPATRRVEATPGRNDPCPCGSGKKYKKCHGANA